MTNIIHKFLDYKYTIPEAFALFVGILAYGYIMGIFFGRKIQIFLGLIFITLAVYGFIREWKK